MQGHQQGGNLRVTALPGEDLRHYRAGLFATERLVVVRDAVQGVRDHKHAKGCHIPGAGHIAYD